MRKQLLYGVLAFVSAGGVVENASALGAMLGGLANGAANLLGMNNNMGVNGYNMGVNNMMNGNMMNGNMMNGYNMGVMMPQVNYSAVVDQHTPILKSVKNLDSKDHAVYTATVNAALMQAQSNQNMSALSSISQQLQGISSLIQNSFNLQLQEAQERQRAAQQQQYGQLYPGQQVQQYAQPAYAQQYAAQPAYAVQPTVAAQPYAVQQYAQPTVAQQYVQPTVSTPAVVTTTAARTR
jgi:hypothetical protein